MVRVQRQNIERLNINAKFNAILTSDSAKSPSLLSCLSSAPVGCSVASCPPPPQLLVAPLPPVQQCLHLSSVLLCAASRLVPLLLWCGHLSSAPAGCPVTSLHAATFGPPAPLPSLHCCLSLRPLMPCVRQVVLSPISTLFTSATRREIIASSLAVLRVSSSTIHREFAQ
jgi:hypothetical protein